VRKTRNIERRRIWPMLGGMISDLEAGDEFKAIRYVVSPLMTAEYAHGVEETDEWYFSDDNELGRQVRIPLMIHADKMRLLELNCPKEARLSGIRGPDARVHYEYHARHRSPAYVGEELVVTGRILERYLKRGRVYLHYQMEVHAADGRLVTEYTDRTLLKYRPGDLS
jgi:hypothetical protein